MPVLHQLQPSFNNGEISPLLYDRVDYNKFTSSVKSGKNMFVHPQGGMSNRAGTRMLGQSKDEYVRLIPFEFSNTETYMIGFGNGYCRFYTTNGQVVTEDGLPYEIVSPFSTADLDKIRYVQSGDVMYLAWGGAPKTLTRYGHTNWQFDDYDYKNGPVGFIKEYKAFLTKTEATSGYKFISYQYPSDSTYYSSPTSYVSGEDMGWVLFPSLNNKISSITKENNMLFSLVNQDGVFYYSYSLNGRDWNLFGNNLYEEKYSDLKVFYNGSLFLMTASDSRYYLFSNPLSVSVFDFPISVDTIKCVNNVFFIKGSSKKSDIYYSTNGTNWTKLEYGYKTSMVISPIPSIFYNNTYYGIGLANGYNYMFSWNSSLDYLSAERNDYMPSDGVLAFGKLWSTKNVVDSSGRYYVYYWDPLTPNQITSVFSQPTNQNHIIKVTYYGGDKIYFMYANSWNTAVSCSSSGNIEYISSAQGQNIHDIIPFDFPDYTSELQLNSTNYIFNEKDVGKNFALLVKSDSDYLNTELSGNYINPKVFLSSGSWTLITSGTWSGSVIIETSEDGTLWNKYRGYTSPSTSSGANFNVTGSFDYPVFVRIKGQNISGTATLSFTVQSSEFYIFVKGAKLVSSSLLTVVAEEDSDKYISYVLNISGNLYLSSWEKGKYPTEVELYQDRIEWFTNNKIDATKISNYTDFGVSTDVTEDDAISVIIKDKKINKINSAIAGSKLVVFTDSGNFIHNNDTFTPNSATFLKQGSTGGADIKPVIVRDNIIYVHPMKQAISDYAYSFETDGYAGQDITILANHLFENKKIKTLAYQQEPYSIIWVLQEEGTVLACTYLRQQNVIAWTPMDFGGKVLSIGVLSNGSNEELYLAVQRKNGTFVEKMPTRLPDADPKERFFVDCGRTYRGEPANIISGLDHLEGEKVIALADGKVVKDLVVENGQITLPTPASIVTVGLPYESVLETLTFDVSQGDGSNLNRKKRVVAVSVRYNNSRGSRVSVNGHREVPMLERKIENTDTDISLKSGFYREILPSAHKEPTTIKIRQDEPLPITIVSIIPELEYEQ